MVVEMDQEGGVSTQETVINTMVTQDGHVSSLAPSHGKPESLELGASTEGLSPSAPEWRAVIGTLHPALQETTATAAAACRAGEGSARVG